MPCQVSSGQRAGGPEGAAVVVPTTLPATDISLRPFDELGTITSTSGAGWETIVSYGVERGWRGRLEAWGHDAAVAAAFQNVQWRIIRNGECIKQYPAICQYGSLLSAEMTPFQIDLWSMCNVALQVLNNSGTNYVVYGRLRGVTKGSNGVEF